MNKILVGRVLLISGLVLWASLMLYIVISHQQTGAKPSVELMLTTIGCWAIFFVGKTMLKSPEVQPHND
jgi:hypothetical protein